MQFTVHDFTATNASETTKYASPYKQDKKFMKSYEKTKTAMAR